MTTRTNTPVSAAGVLAVRIRSRSVLIDGDLSLPHDARGVVVFAHGSGSSRFSERNRWVASTLQEAGFATLLIDLLTQDEAAVDAHTGRHRFDIPLLAHRVMDAIAWLARTPTTRTLPIGLFGASTGAAAALVAAAERPEHVRAVVSRGGRPDLAGDALARVHAPTLLIVGARDPEVLALNRAAQARLTGISAIELVPNATHLFEEPGTLERVAVLAGQWFTRHLKHPTIVGETAAGW